MKTLSPPPLLFPSTLKFWGARRLETTVCGSHPRALRARVTGVGMCKQKISTAVNDDVHLHASTSTGPILLSVNPFCRMGGLHLFEAMERYRRCSG